MVEKREPLIDINYAYDIVKNSNVVVFEWTLDISIPTKYVSSNIDQFGYTPDDFYSGPLKDFWQFVHPEDRRRVKEEVYQARKIGETFNHHYRILTKAGQVRWIEERILYEKENGEISSEKGIIFDITERMHLAHALERSKDRYQRIFENSSVIIFTIDLEGTIDTINKMFVKTLGYGDEIIGSNIRDLLIHQEDIKKIFSPDIEAFDISIRCANDTMKIFNISTNIIDSANEEIEIVAVDVSQKIKDEEKIRYLSYHDKLTSVYNRAYFDDFIDGLDDDKRYPFSIIIGDMNGLKDLNDHHGHKTGDQLIRKMAEICKKSCRESDIVCRIGGDEFAIVCPETGEDGAKSVCNRIRNLCQETHIEHIGHPSIALGYSTKLSGQESIDKIFKEADNNMYRNKLTHNDSSTGMYLKSLLSMLEKSGFEDAEHAEEVKKYALLIAEACHLKSSDLEDLGVASKLHDIGKIGVPNELLNKAGSLSVEEYEIIKGHSYFGYALLCASPSTLKISEIILHHHEWFDGTGYPDGLKQEEIPLLSRIISITDAYVVMTHDCPYRSAMTREDAMEELKSQAGRQFDPVLVDIFIDIIRKEYGFKSQELQSLQTGI